MPSKVITTELKKAHADDTRKQTVHHVSDGETTIMVSSVEEIDPFGFDSTDWAILGIPEGYILHESMGFLVDGDGKVNWAETFCIRPANHERALNKARLALSAKHFNDDYVMWVDKHD